MDKFKAFLKNSVGYIMAVIFTAGYISLSILTIDKTGRSIDEIIGTGFVFYLYQIALTTLFRSQGLMNGKNNEAYQETNRIHGEKVEQISDDMDFLQLWCDKKNKLNYKKQRTKILAREALKYSDYFDEDGTAIKTYILDTKKMSLKWSNRFVRREEKRRYKAWRKAANLKLSELDATSITSGDKTKEDRYALPESEKEFVGRNTVKDVLMKALPAILFGLYGVKEVAGLTWSHFAWTVFQALTGFASAIPQMLSARSYIVNEVRTGTVKKIGWIDDFSADLERDKTKLYGGK